MKRTTVCRKRKANVDGSFFYGDAFYAATLPERGRFRVGSESTHPGIPVIDAQSGSGDVNIDYSLYLGQIQSLYDVSKDMEAFNAAVSANITLPRIEFSDAPSTDDILCGNGVEIYSTELLKARGLTHLGWPLFTKGHGNCLFEAISVLLTGGSTHHMELRVRTIVELLCNVNHYTITMRGSNAFLREMTFKEVIENTILSNSAVGLTSVLAAASVVGRAIYVSSPALPTSPYYCETLLAPRNQTVLFASPMHLLWTKADGNVRDFDEQWAPNHFCPLLKSSTALEITYTGNNVGNLDRARARTPEHNEENMDNGADLSDDGSEYDSDEIRPLVDRLNCPPRRVRANTPSVDELRSPLSPHNVSLYSDDSNAGDTFTESLATEERAHPSLSEAPLTEERGATDTGEEPNISGATSACSDFPVPSGKYFSNLELLSCSRGNDIRSEIIQRPQHNLTYAVAKGTDNSMSDGWRWKCLGGKSIYVDNNGETLQQTKVRGVFSFLRNVRSGRKYTKEVIDTTQTDIFNLSLRTYEHCAIRHFRRRVTDIFQLFRVEHVHPAVVEYMWFGDMVSLHNLPHGNDTTTADEFLPSSSEILDTIRQQVSDGVPLRMVRRQVANSRNMRQIYNVANRIRQSAEDRSDPWGEVLRQHGSDIRSQKDEKFIRAVYAVDGKIACSLYLDSQLETMVSNVGSGNLASLDTTFGNTAYASFFTFRNLKLIDKERKQHPIFTGPSIVHSDEKDARAFMHWFADLRERIPSFVPYFCTDQCAMLQKRLVDAWPDSVHVLGREHLLYNLRDRKVRCRVAEEDYTRIKSDLFGPRIYDDRPPIMEAATEVEFDARYEKYSKDWEKMNDECKLMGNWIRSRINTYKAKASAWALQKAGVDCAWQQSAERMNRVLKEERTQSIRRSPLDLIREIKNVALDRQREEERAISGEGAYTLDPQFQQWKVAAPVWNTMTDESKKEHMRKFRSCGATKAPSVTAYRPLNDLSGRKKGDRLGRPAPRNVTPMSTTTACAQSNVEAGPVAGSATTPCAQSNVEAPVQRRHWENNNTFYLTFASPESNSCASCNEPILNVAIIAGERLVFRHKERYVYPTGPAGSNRWTTTGLSRSKERNFYYHATAECMFSRFRREYFENMPLVLGDGVRGELRGHPLDIRHPAFSFT